MHKYHTWFPILILLCVDNFRALFAFKQKSLHDATSEFVIHSSTGKTSQLSFDIQRQQLDLISFCDARFSLQVCAIVRPVNEASAENVVAPRIVLHKSKVSHDLDVQEKWNAWRAPKMKLQPQGFVA